MDFISSLGNGLKKNELLICSRGSTVLFGIKYLLSSFMDVSF